MPKPEELSYHARDGIYKTLFSGGDDDAKDFNEFVAEGLKLCDGMQPSSFRILDTFLSDTIQQSTLERMFKLARQGGDKVQLLILNPASQFAVARAEALSGLSALDRANRGAGLVHSALEHLVHGVERTGGLSIFGDRLRSEIHELSREYGLNLELRLYSAVPLGPLFFFRDLALAGSYSAYRSSRDMPWHIVVKDRSIERGLFEILEAEFIGIWDQCRSASAYTIMISHNGDDVEDASELKKWLQAIEGVAVKMDATSMRAGENWKTWISESVRAANEVLVHIGSGRRINPWVTMEIGAAWYSGKPIVFVKNGDAREPKLLRDLNINCARIDTEAGKEKLAGEICQRISRWRGATERRRGGTGE